MMLMLSFLIVWVVWAAILVTQVVRRHRMDPSIFPTMLSGERWSKQVSTTVALTVQTLYGEVFSAITWYSMAWHGVVGTLTDQTLYGGGSPDICGPGKSALNVGVQCSCPPFKNQMLQNFDKTYCLKIFKWSTIGTHWKHTKSSGSKRQPKKRSITRNKTCCRSHKSGDIHLSIWWWWNTVKILGSTKQHFGGLYDALPRWFTFISEASEVFDVQ